MTVCIAAFAAKSKAIVCIADRALTYAGYAGNAQTDSGITKIIDLPGGWCTMFSCSSLTFPKNIVDRIVSKITPGTVVNRKFMEDAAKEAFEHEWWNEIEDHILKPILLNRDDFAARSQNVQPLDPKLVLKIAEEMSEYKQVCSMIFCGFEGSVPQMFMLNTPCELDPYDWQGFAVIGEGLEAARNQMIWQQYDKDDSLQSVLYDVFSSKVATEILQGVGYQWDWRILVAGKGTLPIPKHIDDLIDKVWVALNRSPFAPRKLTKSETPPKDWKQKLEDYSTLVLMPPRNSSPPTKRSASQKSEGQP